MCLEFLNQFLLSGLAWWVLGMFAAIIAALAAAYFWASPNKTSATGQTSSFTCPCYAPPPEPSKK